eukprot:364345-Chlamydomonas_euryale.AAC.4
MLRAPLLSFFRGAGGGGAATAANVACTHMRMGCMATAVATGWACTRMCTGCMAADVARSASSMAWCPPLHAAQRPAAAALCVPMPMRAHAAAPMQGRAAAAPAGRLLLHERRAYSSGVGDAEYERGLPPASGPLVGIKVRFLRTAAVEGGRV